MALSIVWACGSNNEDGSAQENAESAGIVNASIKTPLDSINEYIKLNPNDAGALAYRAMRHSENHNLSYAIADATAAHGLDSNRADVLLAWGDVHYLSNKTRVSRDSWEKCIKLDPKNIDCRLKLAELYSVVQEYEKSLKLCNQVIDIDPTNAVAFYVKGLNIRDMSGDTTQALQYIQKAIDLDPEYFIALDMAAVLLAYQHNALAEVYYNRMLELRPNNRDTYYKLGMYYMENKDFNKAIETFIRCTQLDPNDAESYYNLGYIHMELGVNKEAREYFSKSIQAQPLNHRAYYARGYVWEKGGDLTNAAKDYREALKLNPQHQASRVSLERVLRESK